MTTQTAPPVLSTPETNIFEDPTPPQSELPTARLTTEEIWDIYEVDRTAREIIEGGYSRVALQFPDKLLRDSVRVFEALEGLLRKLRKERNESKIVETNGHDQGPGRDGRGQEDMLEKDFNALDLASSTSIRDITRGDRIQLYILADTSYGSCCVDEIAAEHVDAEVVVHYGRSCLSPTARLPVIYVFTSHSLDLDPLVEAFEGSFLVEERKEEDTSNSRKELKVILMADITYHNHVDAVYKKLKSRGWNNIYAPEITYDPSSQIPNRKLNPEVEADLKQYKLFHISDPPPALLLTLSSRVDEMYIYPTNMSPIVTTPSKALRSNTALALRRRYGLITRLSTAPILGILINTLSVRNYLSSIARIQNLITAAGKKYYTFVVGKVNAAKIANFSEVEGWVVIGCWESSLIENGEFWRPVVTPFELGMVLKGDGQRVWNGEWWGGFEGMDEAKGNGNEKEEVDVAEDQGRIADRVDDEVEDGADGEDSEPESAPPEFDLRTGRYVSNSRPMRNTESSFSQTSRETISTTEVETIISNAEEPSKVLTRKTPTHLATINGAVSPGAEYLRSQRTWAGLGSDFVNGDDQDGLGDANASSIEEGRSGIARGYRVGDDGNERT